MRQKLTFHQKTLLLFGALANRYDDVCAFETFLGMVYYPTLAFVSLMLPHLLFVIDHSSLCFCALLFLHH
jgi:hypothetical protein